MIKIMKNVAKCQHCQTYIGYDDDDIKIGESEYYAYGCEVNISEYKYITCPICENEIRVNVIIKDKL